LTYFSSFDFSAAGMISCSCATVTASAWSVLSVGGFGCFCGGGGMLSDGSAPSFFTVSEIVPPFAPFSFALTAPLLPVLVAYFLPSAVYSTVAPASSSLAAAEATEAPDRQHRPS
jgi:hypothetical protein